MKISKQLSWILFVSRRFASVDKKGRGAITSILASFGIAFGVMTLIVVISVMNGFQMSYIDSIIELSSGHIRVSIPKESETNGDKENFEIFCKNNKEIKTLQPFFEGQSLIATNRGRQQGALIKAVSPNIIQTDSGFAKEMKMLDGSFDLSNDNSIVLGTMLAYSLGVEIGDEVTLLALSGKSDVDLINKNRIFTVVGIFSCGYNDINSTFAFVSNKNKDRLFGQNATPIYEIKLFDGESDGRIIAQLKNHFSNFEFESWRSYNRAFFGALKVEKNMLLMLVFLIFLVVSVNIYNAMKRMVFEKREEICILSALGGKPKFIQAIFVFQGFLTGFLGALPGAALGILISINMEWIFSFVSKIAYQVQNFFTWLFMPEMLSYVRQNMVYMLYATIPAKMVFSEIMMITLFGVLASLLAAWFASKKVLTLSIAEVLRDE